MSEYTKALAGLNGIGDMQLGDLPDRGLTTGIQPGAGSHGVGIGPDETNSLGGFTGDSDPVENSFNHNIQDFTGSFGEASITGPDFTGAIASFNAASDAPGEENVNDADAGQQERKNYA